MSPQASINLRMLLIGYTDGYGRQVRATAHTKFKSPRPISANGQASQPCKVALGRDRGA
jgi:hypothetical protein